jgi:hypothetical protein
MYLMGINKFYDKRFSAWRCGGIPCCVSLNLLIKLTNIHLFNTCSSATILQNRCYLPFFIRLVRKYLSTPTNTL